jgi:hypothetical protein
LIALFVSFSACFLVAYRGTDDYESSYKSEQNLGGEYRSTREPGIGLPSGIKRAFAVPVWNQTQGLGQRMPTLMYSQTQSPFIFFDYLVPIEVNFTVRLFSVTFLALAIGNLIILSWGTLGFKRRLLFLDISLLGPLVLYTIHNDWYCQAEQYWGLFLVIISFFHRDFFARSKFPRGGLSILPAIGFLLGFAIVLTNHPTWYSITAMSLPFLIIQKGTLRVCRYLGLKLLGLLSLLIYFLLVQIADLATVPLLGGSKTYVTQGSTWDFFTNAGWVYKFQPILAPIAATAHPILYLINEAGSRTEFFNLSLLILSLLFVRRISIGAEVRRLVLQSSYASLLLIACLMLSGAIARQNFLGTGRFFTSHAWWYAHPVFVIVLVSSTILFGERNILSVLFVQRSRLPVTFALFAVVLSLLYPTVLYFNDSNNSQFSIFRNSRIESVNERELVKSERFADLSVSRNDSESDWNSIFGTRFSMQLSRAGYPTIEFFGAARQSETLSAKSEPYRSGYVPNTADCRPEVLEFLAVSSIFVNTEDASGCRAKLLDYFGEDSVREINKVAGPPGTASLFRPKSFSSWSIVTDSDENPSVSCPLLEQDCLKGLEVTELPATGEAPFRLCENDCLFTYKWTRTENSKQILLPVNFDKTIEIKDSLTGERLKTANYQGLLAVQIDGDETSGVFTGDIQPDLMMWLRVAMTYLHTIVFVGALVAMLVKGVRAVKEISKAPESQPVS